MISLLKRLFSAPVIDPPPSEEQPVGYTWPGPRAGATVLFLDFDGVLHRAENGSFEFIPQLEAVLSERPEVDVVLSTNWRESSEAEDLLAIFPADVRSRIVGANPVLAGAHARQRECEAYARTHGITRYVALDDDSSLFSPGCAFLFATQRHWGLDDEAAARLSIRLAALDA